MSKGQPPKGSQGMTLVEVLAAALLLSVIVASVLQLYGQSWTVSAQDEERLVAAHLAQLTLEAWLAAHEYQDVQAKLAENRLRTLNNDSVLKEIWEGLLPGLWGEGRVYEGYTPLVELAQAVPERADGPIRVTVTISGKLHRGVTLHGIKADAAS